MPLLDPTCLVSQKMLKVVSLLAEAHFFVPYELQTGGPL